MKLHPALAAWFLGRFGELSEIQRKALRHTLAAKNTLILAPTGSGKTLAAFLSVLSELAREAETGGLPNAVRAVYVSPLKALDRDIHRNLQGPLEAVNEALPETRHIRMEVRTGDTGFSERGKQQRKRPHLLLTTPESLSSLLSQAGWREGGFEARAAIVDEIHAFAENKRGTLLALSLERLEARAKGPMQRIGLSATAWPIDAITRLLCGERVCKVAKVDLKRAHRLDIATLPPGEWLPPAGHNPYRVAQPVADLVARARCSLVFTSTRSAAERLGLALKILLPEWDDRIAVHHGSVDRETREEIESGLADGALKAVVCSTSLELGVDFDSVDQVLLIGAPRGVSRALQRLGRSGHRVGGVAIGSLVPLSLPDLVECVALKRAASEGNLDMLRIPEAPLDVLAQVLLGMSIERPWPLDAAYALVKRSGPYRNLRREEFDSVIAYLSGSGRVLGSYAAYGKIIVEEGQFRIASRKAARDYYMNTGVISGDFQIRVVTRRNRRLGEVPESFLESLQPNEAFIIAGKSVAVKRLHQNTAVVEPARGERVKTPRWVGNKMPLAAQLASEELKLRRALRRAWEQGRRNKCIAVLEKQWDVNRQVAERVAAFIERQTHAAPVPVDAPVQVEQIVEKNTLLILFHVVAGRAVNRSLAWVLASRLARGGSIVANFDDHSFLLSLDARNWPDEERLRAGFDPRGWREDLETVIATTETLGRRFRAIAETGQLLPRRTLRGEASPRMSSWNGYLLYLTLREHEPDHPLVKETIRVVSEDECDSGNAFVEAARIFHAPWEVFTLPRPSPFALPVFAAFDRETLIAQDPDRALDDLVAGIYRDWERDPELIPI